MHEHLNIHFLEVLRLHILEKASCVWAQILLVAIRVWNLIF